MVWAAAALKSQVRWPVVSESLAVLTQTVAAVAQVPRQTSVGEVYPQTMEHAGRVFCLVRCTRCGLNWEAVLVAM